HNSAVHRRWAGKALRVARWKPDRCEKPTMRCEAKTILFADIVGYGKLSEGVIPEFVRVFLSKLSRLIAESLYSPLRVNMWGDEIYGVFDHVHEAGLFSLQLSKFLREEEQQWLKKVSITSRPIRANKKFKSSRSTSASDCTPALF